MKICCVSDFQGQALKIYPSLIPEADMFIVAGDISSWGNLKELENFNDWLRLLPHRYKIVCGGNHDTILEQIDGHSIFTNATYLQDEMIEIEGLKIYGSPVSHNDPIEVPAFRAFSDYEEEACTMISEGLDILITHGPPFMILDKLWDGRHVGSKFLADAIKRTKPRFSVFGHLHSNHGILKQDDTTFVSVALCSDDNILFKGKNELFFDPIIIDL